MEKPANVKDLAKIEPMHRHSENECYRHLDADYKFPGWRSGIMVVRVNTSAVEAEDDRLLNFEEKLLECGSNPYGVQFACAICLDTGEWIAFLQSCEPINGIKGCYTGKDLIEKYLKRAVGEAFKFDGENDLFCEWMP